MSRTYRRKGVKHCNMYFTDLEYFVSDYVLVEYAGGFHRNVRVPYEKDSKEYKKGLARFHSDGATHNFKEPGPSWFRNMTNTRPLRQQGRQEIQKWMRNEEYEPLIDAMGHLEYWT